MRRLLRRSIRIGFAVLAASAAVSTAAAAQQQRGGMLRGDPQQVRLNESGDPDFQKGKRARPSGFRLFGNADVANSGLRSPANIIFSARNTGGLDIEGGLSAYNNDDDPDLGACCYPTHFRYLSFYWATPPSERAKIISEAGVAGSGLQFALGDGYNVRGWHSQNGGDNNLAVDATLGAYHSGVQSTSDRSCRDMVFNGNFGAGLPLLAVSDCPETWGSLGWRGMKPVGLDDFLAAATLDPATFRFDHWRIPSGDPSTGTLERQFGSFQTYGLFSDYSTDDLCTQPTTLAASAVRDSKSGDLIVKIVNGGGAAAALKFQLAGLPTGELRAIKSVLTGADADAFNEDGQPPAAKPVVSETTLTPNFDYEAPANSLTVFRVKP